MQIISDIEELQKTTTKLNKENKTIGFVPTLGALHAGHMSLVKESKRNNDITIVSIFVNPAQFGPQEDLTKYPRPFENDKKLLVENNVDYLFYPKADEIYPPDYKTYVKVNNLSDIMEGKSRQGHFTGVATVVLKLLNLVQPTATYFGQKDLQQFLVIKKLIKDLHLSVNLHMMSIIREPDGLALSSRNVYLDQKERKNAIALSQSLELAEQLIKKGEKNAGKIKKRMEKLIENYQGVAIDYIAICEVETLSSVQLIDKKVAILVAAKLGKTRLIDNIIV